MYGQAQPYGYYGAPAAVVFREPDHTSSTFAGVLWILFLVRNLLMIPLLFVAGAFLALLNIGLGAALWILLTFPVIGMVGCVLAMASGFQCKNHAMGTVGGVLALVGSSFPGPFFGFGIVGIVLGVIGLALHLAARKEWK